MRGTHAELRTNLLRKGLTMQEALEACAVQIAECSPYMEKLLDKVVERKINGETQIAKAEADNIYRLIESSEADADKTKK